MRVVVPGCVVAYCVVIMMILSLLSYFVFCFLFVFFFFFFQAEDGIRDWSVTGVQTCALPISLNS